MIDHNFWMARCFELGSEAKKHGESPVGSLIVCGNQLVAEAEERSRRQRDITFHAEMEVIRIAIKSISNLPLQDSTLYTTHEPCVLCSYAIRHYRIKVVVFSLSTGELGGFHSKYSLLSDTNISSWGPPPAVVQMSCADY